MSGIVGIVSFDGTPADEGLLRRMTDFLAYRGPDRQRTWADSSAGLGHALLSTTIESEHEEQPTSLDGATWITADARVDGRAALVEQLESRGRSCLRTASDAQLILHAYHAWGEDCVEHLLGDFAFAIWDGPRGRLFCGRDHFGIKPFYYAPVSGGIVFSNTLDCVRMHPGVGGELNELAVGDFLLFGFNQDLETTTFERIRRLPPAHSLTCESSTVRTKRYWTLPTDGRIRYRRPQEYIDHFREVLRVAVADRLRTNKVGVWMSGGLDSTSIAATAQQLLSERPGSFELRAHTIVYDTLIPDDERHYARLAAEALSMPIDFFVADAYRPFQGWEDTGFSTPEPSDDLFFLMNRHQHEQAALHSRVVLCGEGGDEILWRSYLLDLVGRVQPLELVAGLARSVLVYRRRPGAGMRSRLKQWLQRESQLPEYPAWLNASFTSRLGLRTRWMKANAVACEHDHPVRPDAYRRLTTAPWSWYFESFDPGVTGVPVEARYPFLDLRVVNYLLAIPPLPWCVDKQLLRLAMRDDLPESIRLRRKAPLAGDPLSAFLRRSGFQGFPPFEPTLELEQFVDLARIPRLTAEPDDPDDSALLLRPRCLSYWLSRVAESVS